MQSHHAKPAPEVMIHGDHGGSVSFILQLSIRGTHDSPPRSFKMRMTPRSPAVFATGMVGINADEIDARDGLRGMA